MSFTTLGLGENLRRFKINNPLCVECLKSDVVYGGKVVDHIVRSMREGQSLMKLIVNLYANRVTTGNLATTRGMG
jgi:hypothetical protein